jgi:hypothetical protein
MKKLKSLDIKSVFRVSLVLGAVAGVLVGMVIFIADILDGRILEGFAFLVLTPIVQGVMGGLINAFMAKVYNLVAARLGGIEVELE